MYKVFNKLCKKDIFYASKDDHKFSLKTNKERARDRLAFHDCVGGCNGCININNPDNNGLQPLGNGI